MAVSTGPVLGVFGFVVRLVLRGRSCEMMNSLPEARIAPVPHDYLATLPALFGYRSDAALHSERLVVSFGERPGRLREKRGANDSSYSGHRHEDFDVPVVALLSFGRVDGHEFVQQGRGTGCTETELFVHETKTWQQEKNVLACVFHDSSRYAKGGGLEDREQVVRGEATNATGDENPLDCRRS
jgi:hypothetical protein